MEIEILLSAFENIVQPVFSKVSRLQVFDFAMKCYLCVNTENEKHREDFQFEVLINLPECRQQLLFKYPLNGEFDWE